MKKTFIAFILIPVIAISFIAFAKTSTDTEESQAFYKNLEKSFITGKDKIFLKDITDFEWDFVVFAGGYEPLQEFVEKTCKKNFPTLKQYGKNSESEGAWIFIKDDQVHVIKKNRAPNIFVVNENSCFSKKNVAIYYTSSEIPYNWKLKKNYSAKELIEKRSELFPPCSKESRNRKLNIKKVSDLQKEKCSMILINTDIGE